MNRRNFIKTTAAGTIGAGITSRLVSQTVSTENGQIPRETISSVRGRIKPITPDERLERIERAYRFMNDSFIDVVLMEGGSSMKYFSGVEWGRSERPFIMILPKDSQPVFIGPKFEEKRAHEQIGGARLMTWEENEDPYIVIRQALKDAGALTGTIGIEETTRFFIMDNLAKNAGSLAMLSGTPVTAGCRSVKSAHEIELMQIANDMTRAVFEAAISGLKTGMTEAEFGGIITEHFAEFGVEGGALVLFGEASAYPHGSTREHALKEDDIVLIDGGCAVEGYNSDVTRTTVLGKPTEKMKKVWYVVRQAQEAALHAAKPDVPAEKVDAAARKVINDAGFGPGYASFTHRLGHGIGLDGHEWYYLVQGNPNAIEAHNTFTDEPGIYIPGEFGIRLEDTIVILHDETRPMLPPAESIQHIFS